MQTFLQPFPENVSLTRIDPLAIERLKEIQVPMLIITGSLDVLTFLQFSETLEQQVPRAKRIVIPGVAHMVSMEAPQIFSDHVVEFISEHE
jgi:3-oxoadipate enol-lactonase